jgi:bifunctional non-homologous end joining protein LigD
MDRRPAHAPAGNKGVYQRPDGGLQAESGGLKMEACLEIDGKKVKLSNLDKVFWPREGYTKHDLLRFYIDISPYLLPFLKERPCNFQRFPDGIDGKRFYQKNIPSFAPGWIKNFPIPSKDRVINYIVVDSLATLVYVTNLACLEMHPWHSRTGRIKTPDYGIIDLDPQEGVSFETVLEVAVAVKKVLDNLGLAGYPKTSGATGLQVYLPLEPVYTYNQVRDIIGVICGLVHERVPAITSMERKVARRGATVYLDYLQNQWGQTINAPYTVRPVPGASVSTPLTWEEVEQGRVRPEHFTIKNILARLIEKGDLFAPVLAGGQVASGIRKRYAATSR